MPTRNARNGTLFTTQGMINIRNKKWQEDFSPIDPELDCATSQRYSKAYLRHLIISGEILGSQIATMQNLRLYLWLTEQARAHVLAGDFTAWKNIMVQKLMQKV
jgi:queuine tRNA-ribosyltransferase